MTDTTQGFVAAFQQLFLGRRDVYATGYQDPEKPTKYRYTRVSEPLTDEVVLGHLRGDAIVGIYPIMLDNTVGWFCVDFDAPGVEDPFEVAWVGAVQQAERFLENGLHVHIERSRSGTGCHVWGFLDQPVPAKIVRDAIRPFLLEHISLDRIFPVQDELTATKNYGNLIAAPFFGPAVKQGNSVFLDRDGQPLNPRTFLANVTKNAPAVLMHLAAKAPKRRSPERTPSAIISTNGERDPQAAQTGALKVISPYGCSFMRHCATHRKGLQEPMWYAALQVASQFEHGRDFGHLLSMGDDRYDPSIVDAKFDQVLANERIGCAWIHDNYPKLACSNCPANREGLLRAPHWVAKKSILELAAGKRAPMRRIGNFAGELNRARAGIGLRGYKWGFEPLDQVTRLRPSEFVAIGAAPSMGKTAMLVFATLRLAKQGIPVMAFSAETAEEGLRTRLLACESMVDTRKITGEHPDPLTAEDWRRLEKASATLETLPIYLDYSSLSADDVLAQVESVVLANRIPLDQPYVVFFDYLQFGSKMLGDTTEYDRISRLSTEFKFTAKILERPVVVFSQLRRDAEGSDKPDMTFWKNSGRIESDQDLGIILVGDRVEGREAPRQAWITKQREGIANKEIRLILDQTTCRWSGTEFDMREEQNEADPLFIGGTNGF